MGVDAEEHVPVGAQAELVGEEEDAQRIPVAAVEVAVDPGEHHRLPQSELEPVAQPRARPMREEVAVDHVPERVAVLQRTRQRLELEGPGPDQEAGLDLRVAVVAEPDAGQAHRSPVPIHLAVVHVPVLELRARVRLHHAPRQLEILPARPLGIVDQARLRGRSAH